MSAPTTMLDQLDIDHFAARLLQDALNEATANYWEQRARDFMDARPREDDRPGAGGLEEMRRAWRRCHAAAKACRGRASVARIRDGCVEPDVWAAFGAVAEQDLRDALDAGDASTAVVIAAKVDALEAAGAYDDLIGRDGGRGGDEDILGRGREDLPWRLLGEAA